MNKKIKVARLSVFSNISLIILKTITGFMSGSVSILSEAIHSFMDLIAALIAFVSVKFSDNPPDKEHPYGYGKLENVSGVVEALLITLAAGWIIFEAIKKITHNDPVENIAWATLVMVISGAVNFVIARKLYKTAEETDSVALKADALHLMTDVYTSLGVAFGMAMIWIFKIHILDPIVAILVAAFIFFKSFHMMKEAFMPLIDSSLSENEINVIKDCINRRSISFHNLKTRKSGSFRFAEFHLELNENMTLKEVHDICDDIEEDIKAKIKNAEINIHVEPISKSGK